MNKTEIFNNTRAISQNSSLQRGALEYGTKPILFSENARPLNKLANSMARVKQSGVLPTEAKIGHAGLMHGPDSNPPFVDVLLNETQYYVNLRVVQYDGHKHFTNSDFSIDSVAGDLRNGSSNFITGVCLFGVNTATGVTNLGKEVSLTDPLEVRDSSKEEKGIIKKLQIDRRIHPYEADTILRIGNFIKGLGLDNQKLSVHIPRIEYYLYGLDFLKKGLIEIDTLKEWIGEVDKRSEGIFALMNRRVPASMQCKPISPLDPINNYIKESDEPNMETAIAKLNHNPLWKKLLQKNPPRNFTDLGYLSYQHAYLSLAQNGLLIAVENPEEQSIITNTKKSIELIDKGTIVGLYPHPNVLLKEGARKLLYYYPNHNNSTTRALVEIFRANK